MSEANKAIIRALNAGFERGDHDMILSCLADDVVWHVPAFFTARGRQVFKS